MSRRYCKEDIDVDIEASTKVETAETEGKETERNGILETRIVRLRKELIARSRNTNEVRRPTRHRRNR